MNTHFKFGAAAVSVAAALALFSSSAAASPVRICTFKGSPSAALDKLVAKETFKAAGIDSTFVQFGDAGGDDDGVSLKELHATLGRDCDVIAGFPRSHAADASDGKMLFSRGYLNASYVSVGTGSGASEIAPREIVAATYGSPSQLIAVQEQHVRFVLENTPERTVDAVASGRAGRAIVWYPAVVAYEKAHAGRQFDVRKTHSPYSDWQLVFAFKARANVLQRKVDTALDAMQTDGRLAELTRAWMLPATIRDARAKAADFAYLDGPVRGARIGLLRAVRDSDRMRGRFVKVSDAAGTAAGAPSFDRTQVAHGKRLYAANCAKCHGADMQGVTAPALSGAAFAPASNSHLTIGGIYNYMATNMPADRPGKLKDGEYADLMAFLLNKNGYPTSGSKLTADAARASTTPLNAGPLSAAQGVLASTSAK
ncbi:c-type cytochrome [Trinickia sp. Y13]|uniref:c-type cytochrome n=1 Tax=Trinickia sp. Y13 TaxID=2917807 RepID=UPI00240678A2|nr:c-type cytochrome [Trinickia sp. Y13]MDG0026900.1 c-type cytochrome [Trinickia sp. Y13]